MNGKRAKVIRKGIYGIEYSPKFRKYRVNTETKQIIADERRMAYQNAKREYTKNKGA